MNVADSILQEGGGRTAFFYDGGGSGAQGTGATGPNFVCGTFNFTDTSEKIIKLAIESSLANANLNIVADRHASYGQRDIHITVRPLLQNSLRAILTGDQVTTKGVSNPEFFTFSYGTTNSTTACTASPCSYLSQSGNYVSSVVRNANSEYTALMNKTYNYLSCSGSAFVGGRYLAVKPCVGTNKSSCNFATGDATSGYDSFGTIMCFGF